MRRDRDEKDSLNKFLDHELKVEGGKPKQPRRTLKDGTARGQAASTPKKNRTVPFGDGFDDGDVVMVSPSKSRDKSRTGTPRQGSKRKRNAVEASPSKPLPILEAQAADDELAAPPYMESENDIFTDTGKDDGKFKVRRSFSGFRQSADFVAPEEAHEPPAGGHAKENIRCVCPLPFSFLARASPLLHYLRWDIIVP